MAESIQDAVKRIIAGIASLPEEDITPDMEYRDCGLDSLDDVILAMNLEDEFGIEISDSIFNNEQLTVQNIIDVVERQKHG